MSMSRRRIQQDDPGRGGLGGGIRTPSPIDVALPPNVSAATLNDDASTPTASKSSQDGLREFRFIHDWRVALVLLPSLFIVASHAGFYAKLTILVGFVATYALDEAQFAREHGLICVWMTVLLTGLFLWITFISAIRISPWNLLLAHNMTQVLFLVGLWGALQFPWIWRESPTIARLMERLLIGILPFPTAVLFSWTLQEMYGARLAAFLASPLLTVVFVVCSVPLPRSESPNFTTTTVLGTSERLLHVVLVCLMPSLMFLSASRYELPSKYAITVSVFLATLPLFLMHSLAYKRTALLGLPIRILQVATVVCYCSGTFGLLWHSSPWLTKSRSFVFLTLVALAGTLLDMFGWSATFSVLALVQFLAIYPPAHPLAFGIPSGMYCLWYLLIMEGSTKPKREDGPFSTLWSQDSVEEPKPFKTRQVMVARGVLISCLSLLVWDSTASWELVGLVLSVSLALITTHLPEANFYAQITCCFCAVLVESRLTGTRNFAWIATSTVLLVVFVAILKWSTTTSPTKAKQRGIEEKHASPRPRGSSLQSIHSYAHIHVMIEEHAHKVLDNITSRVSVDNLTLMVFIATMGRGFALFSAFSSSTATASAALGMSLAALASVPLPSHAVKSWSWQMMMMTMFSRILVQILLCYFLLLPSQLGQIVCVCSIGLAVFCQSTFEQKGRKEMNIPLGALCVIPLLIKSWYDGHLLISNGLEHDFIPIVALACFGLTAASLDIFPNYLFAIVGVIAHAAQHAPLLMILHVSCIVFCSASQSYMIRAGCVFLVMSVQAFMLTFEDDEHQHAADAVVLALTLLTMTWTSHARSQRFKQLAFTQDALYEHIFSQLFGWAFYAQAYYCSNGYSQGAMLLQPFLGLTLTGVFEFNTCALVSVLGSFAGPLTSSVLEANPTDTALVLVPLIIAISFTRCNADQVLFVLPLLVALFVFTASSNMRILIVWTALLGMKTVFVERFLTIVNKWWYMPVASTSQPKNGGGRRTQQQYYPEPSTKSKTSSL